MLLISEGLFMVFCFIFCVEKIFSVVGMVSMCGRVSICLSMNLGLWFIIYVDRFLFDICVSLGIFFFFFFVCLLLLSM